MEGMPGIYWNKVVHSYFIFLVAFGVGLLLSMLVSTDLRVLSFFAPVLVVVFIVFVFRGDPHVYNPGYDIIEDEGMYLANWEHVARVSIWGLSLFPALALFFLLPRLL